MIAAQLAVVRELRDMREAATDLLAKRYLRDRERNASAVLGWLVELREEMRHGPPDE